MKVSLLSGVVSLAILTGGVTAASAFEIGAHGQSETLLGQRHLGNNYLRFRQRYAENLTKEEADRIWRLKSQGKDVPVKIKKQK